MILIPLKTYHTKALKNYDQWCLNVRKFSQNLLKCRPFDPAFWVRGCILATISVMKIHTFGYHCLSFFCRGQCRLSVCPPIDAIYDLILVMDQLSVQLNQCWQITSEILWHSPEGNFNGNAWDIYPWHEFENYLFKITATSPRGQWVKGNIFRVTGPLCGEFTGQQWIPRTKASDTELWCFLWSAPG